MNGWKGSYAGMSVLQRFANGDTKEQVVYLDEKQMYTLYLEYQSGQQIAPGEYIVGLDNSMYEGRPAYRIYYSTQEVIIAVLKKDETKREGGAFSPWI